MRKALLAVTYCLQGNISRSIIESLSSVSYGAAHVLHEQKHESLDKDGGERGQSHMVVGNKEVVFRLLCPPHAVGGLIGWGGSITKALEKETGARIEVSDPVVGCTDQVITVSAMEVCQILLKSIFWFYFIPFMYVVYCITSILGRYYHFSFLSF